MINTRKKRIIALSLGLGLLIFTILFCFNILPVYAKRQEGIEEIDYPIESEKDTLSEYLNHIDNEIVLSMSTAKKIDTKKDKGGQDYDQFIYLNNIGMAKEHQEFLYNLCKEKKIDYLKVLAIIKHESQFNSQKISKTGDYGYMQINKGNHKHLAKTLNTPNKPLDPHINIKWGTYMLDDLYVSWRKQGISDKTKEGEVFSKLDRYVLSSYNKGVAGFKKYGEATKYIKRVEQEYLYLKNLINKAK